MKSQDVLFPAKELVIKNKASFPNETPKYREARNALLLEEIELRRHLERVAEQRRKLPLGGEVLQNYEFVGEKGAVKFSELFEDNETLIIYSYMFGPQREAPCPMCKSFMASLEHKVQDIKQRVGLAMIARSPIERLVKAKLAWGWKQLPIYSDNDGAFTRTYVSKEDADVPGYNVFTQRAGKIYHFWAGEISGEMADPGQDPRGAPDLDILWNLLDTTPEGRGSTWYPKLSYDK